MKKNIATRILAALLSAVLMTGFVVSGAFSTTLRVEAADKTQTAALKAEFDADFYATKYPDIKAAFGTNKDAMFNHFLKFGMKEGRMMNANFDPVAYTTAYPDINAICKKDDYSNAYIHYVTFGKKEGRTLTTNAEVSKKAAAAKNVTKQASYQANIGHGLTVYLNDAQYRSCNIRVYKSDNGGFGAYIDGSLYDTSGNFNSGSCYHYSTVYVNNGNWTESINSEPQKSQKVQPQPVPQPTPQQTTPDTIEDDDLDDDGFDDDEEAEAFVYILMIIAALQDQLENGEITQSLEEYEEQYIQGLFSPRARS